MRQLVYFGDVELQIPETDLPAFHRGEQFAIGIPTILEASVGDQTRCRASGQEGVIEIMRIVSRGSLSSGTEDRCFIRKRR